MRGNARPVWIAGSLFALYLLGALWGREFETLPGLTPWYPPPGLTLAFLLAFGVRYAPVAFVAETVTAVVVFDVQADFTAVQIVINSLALTAIYACAALFLRHGLRIDPRLRSTRDLLWLIGIGAVAAPLAAGFAGVGIRVWAGATDSSEFFESVRTWAAGDALGVVSLTPALLVARDAFISGRRIPWPTTEGVLQALAVIAAVGLAMAVDEDRVVLLFAVILPTAWIALTRSFTTTAAAILLANLATTLVISQTSLGSAQFTDVQLFMMVNAVLALLIADRVRKLRSARAQLAFDATHDPLTSLANRRHFLQRTREALMADREVAVLFFDLDRFKYVNDAAGHEAGDEVLVEVARRLEGVLDPAHLLARFGGDEFTVLLDGPGAATLSATVANTIVHALADPFPVGGRDAVVGASVGIALAHGDRQPHRLLGRADVAMYAAKQRGGDGYAVFDDEMEHATRRRVELEARLRAAIEGDQLELAFQPILDLGGAGTVSVEVLSRWQIDGGEPVNPEEFINLAEDVGLIVPLGHYVLAKACRAAAAWESPKVGPPPAVSVNVSGIQLRSEPFAAEVADVIAASGLPPERLILELTESVLLEGFDDALASLERLHEIGVQLALDDFGKGFSSFSYLGRLPIDLVKIDRQFVVDAERRGPVVISAIVDLAHELGLRAVVEGVETEAQLETARAAGADAVQGFLFGRPGGASAALDPQALRP